MIGEVIVMDKKLKFREDGTFKVLQFTDVHYSEDSEADKRTFELMRKILTEEQPDFVIFTGDTVYSNNNEEMLRKALKPVEDSKTNWAMVFGNHDDEIGASKEKLLKVQRESSLCFSEAGDNKINGVGNYYITINSSKKNNPCWTFYLLDSGSYNHNTLVGGYDYIHRNQIKWYIKSSKSIKKEFGNIPALAFFHIPLPEYNDIFRLSECYGQKNEECCCPKQNSGMFSAMIEMGDIKGVFVGHDHVNDYYGDLYGIKLCYGRATGYNTYGKEGFLRGARVIKLFEDKNIFETWVRLENGEVILNPEKHISE